MAGGEGLVRGEALAAWIARQRWFAAKTRRIQAVVVNPEAEMTRFLTEHTAFRHTPRLAGHLEYRDDASRTTTLAVAQELVADARDGWQWILAELAEPARAATAVTALGRLGRRT